MPLLTVRTNANVEQKQANELLAACSSKLAELLGKPEHYVMTLFETVPAMTMSGRDDPACLMEVRSVGSISASQSRAISEALCTLVSERTAVPTGRIYINFEAVPGAMWGYDGRTFG